MAQVYPWGESTVQEIRRAAGPAADLGDGSWRVVASSPGVARDGLAIPVEAWDTSAYEQNPILLFAHRRDDLDAVLGQATVRKTPTALEADIRFLAPGVSRFADKVRELWEARILRAVSVGASIRAAEPEDDHLRVTDAELLDLSIVPVGGDALALARSLGANFDLDAETLARVFPISKPSEGPQFSAARNRLEFLDARGRR